MNKSLILLCFLPFSINFSKSCDYYNNSVNDNSRYIIINNFSIGTRQSTWGAFHSYTVDTGWKALIYGNNLKNDVSKYRYFSIGDKVSIFCYYNAGDQDYLLKSNNDIFETSHYLVDGQTKTKEFYAEGWDAAGYYQAYVKYNFKLDLSTITLYFDVVVHVYGGWCVSVDEIVANADFYFPYYAYFFNNI